jgi:PadR family transcriptional regulator, regulatory protein PadR
MMIGSFEEIVLLAVGTLQGKAYGVAIKDQIERRTNRVVSVGALQITLRRLDKKGYLSSKHAASLPARGGRPKLYFSLTREGKKVLEETLEVRISFWKSLPQAVLRLR